eukprot:SAG22_NODE_267_length_13330_cov_19.960396_1_plen_183_part_10
MNTWRAAAGRPAGPMQGQPSPRKVGRESKVQQAQESQGGCRSRTASSRRTRAAEEERADLVRRAEALLRRVEEFWAAATLQRACRAEIAQWLRARSTAGWSAATNFGTPESRAAATDCAPRRQQWAVRALILRVVLGSCETNCATTLATAKYNRCQSGRLGKRAPERPRLTDEHLAGSGRPAG